MTELWTPVVTSAVYKGAVKVASSWPLRWQAARLVQKRVSFHVPFWPLFSWLRRLPSERLQDPYVDSMDFLARALEQALGQHPRWARNSATHSKSLTVTHEVYLALISVGKNNQEIRAQLESLQGEFRTKVLERLRNIEEPATRLSRADWATLQHEGVRRRRQGRLQAFQVKVEQVEPYLDVLRTTAPAVAPGSFCLLEGSYGSGKSEQASAWLLKQIERYRLHEGMPVPVHIDARAVEHIGIEERLQREVGLTALRGQGVALVVDGLDEIRSERAARVLDDVNTLLLKYSASKALLTSRSGVLDGHLLLDETNHQEQAPLELDTALRLIASVAGTRPYAALENPAYRENVRLPFFALAAAVAEREGKTHRSRAGLIRGLVETAVQRPGVVRTSIGAVDTQEQLGRLAVNSIRQEASDGITELERLKLLDTGLIRRSEDEARVHFTLPLLEQWFAAQGLKSDPDLVDEATRSSASFESWRWAVAIALEESSWNQYHAIVTRCLTRDLGAGMWLIRETSKNSWVTEEHRGDTDLQAKRLTDVLEYMTRNVPLYTELILPLPLEGERLSFDTSTSRGSVGVNWYSTTDRAVSSQQTAAPQQPPLPVAHWRVAPSTDKTWPWEYMRGRPTHEVDLRFWRHLDLGHPGGLWEQERRYALASELIDLRRGPVPPRISVVTLRRRLDEILEHVDLEHLASYENGLFKVSGPALRDLVKWAQSYPHAEVDRLVPHPMADPNTIESPDDLFPQQLIEKYLLEAHGFGAEIYDEALKGLFCAFEWRWRDPDGAARGVIGVTEDSAMQRTPLDQTVMKIAVPVHLLDEIEREYGAPFLRSSNGRARFRRSSGDRGESLREAVLAVLDREGYGSNGGPALVWSSGVLTISNDRPASLIAHEWIRESFSAVGLDHVLRNSRSLL